MTRSNNHQRSAETTFISWWSVTATRVAVSRHSCSYDPNCSWNDTIRMIFYHCVFMRVSTLANSLVLFINEDTSYQPTPRELTLSFYCFKSSVGWVQSIEVFLHTRCCYDVSVESEMFSINIEHQMHRKCVLIVCRDSRISQQLSPCMSSRN